MNKTDILDAIKSGKEVVSICNRKQIKVINDRIYFFIIGTYYSREITDDNDLKLYNWTIH